MKTSLDLLLDMFGKRVKVRKRQRPKSTKRNTSQKKTRQHSNPSSKRGRVLKKESRNAKKQPNAPRAKRVRKAKVVNSSDKITASPLSPIKFSTAINSAKISEHKHNTAGDSTPEIYYVSKNVLDIGRQHIESGNEISQALVEDLLYPSRLPDEQIMVPVDMRAIGKGHDDYEYVEDMAKRLGPDGIMKAFIKAREYFVANRDNEPDEFRPYPMSVREWDSLFL